MPTETTRNERRIHGLACKRMRKLQGLTQSQVATRAGFDEHGNRLLDHTTVSYIEKGRPCTEATMRHVANGLGVDLDDITYQTVVYVAITADGEAVA